MKSPKLEDPFSPGSGHLPPYLAGREDEQSVFRKGLAKMSAGKSPPAATVLYGPRGMGKTVLLSWFEDEVEQSGAKKNKIRVVWVTPDELKSPSVLWKCLMPLPTLKKVQDTLRYSKMLITNCSINEKQVCHSFPNFGEEIPGDSAAVLP